MDIYLLGRTGRDLRLPVNPTELQVEVAQKTETVNVIGLGDLEIPTGDTPAGISFGSFFPRDYDPGYCRYPTPPRPEDALARLLDWRTSAEPVRLLVTRTSINLLVFVAKVTYRHAGGEPGDIHWELSLRQWREARVRPTAGAAGGTTGLASGRSRADTRPRPQIYVVRSGDTLYGLAKAYLGSGARWRETYDLNSSVIGRDPNRLSPGQRLVMPVE